MNTSVPAALRNIALLSMLSTTALADPAIVLDHNARTGPKAEALMQCEQVARSSGDLGQGLMLSPRVTVAESASAGTRTFILSGTTWENGVRVPIKASCVTNLSGQTVASVSRISNSNVATVQH